MQLARRVFVFAVLAALLTSIAPVTNAATPDNYCGWGTETITRSAATNENAPVVAKTYTVNSGVTVTTSTQNGIVVCAQEVNINGILTAEARGLAGGSLGNQGTGGLGNGGGVGATCNNIPGQAGGIAGLGQASTDSATQILINVVDTASTRDQGASGAGGRTCSTSQWCGGGGGAGAWGAGAAGGNGGTGPTLTAGTGTAGAAGAGWILIYAHTLNVASTGSILAEGSDAGDVATVPSNSCGGGGGAGHLIKIRATVCDIDGTISVNGGDGGNGGGTAATGGNGGTLTTAPIAGGVPTLGGGGGGGGAAGRLDIQCGPGAAAHSSLIDTVSEAAGANCEFAGKKVYTGLDNGDGGGTADDGVLQSGERDQTNYVCNGLDGYNVLLATASESAGANCANGGTKITVGLDNGDGAGDPRDGTLHADEVDTTYYSCKGDTGATGATGAAGAAGADGKNSLITSTAEAPGVNCADGGQKIEAGTDDDTDGVLDAGEVDDTGYACDGADGATGAAGTSFTWLGQWASATTYAANDVVFDNGISYIATTGSTDKRPPNSAWSVLAGANGPNRLTNPGFETYTTTPGVPDGWTAINCGACTITKETTNVYTGSNAVKIVPAGLVTGEGIRQSFSDLTFGHTYMFGAKCRTDGAGSCRVTTDGPGGHNTVTSAGTTGSTTYESLFATFTIVDDAATDTVSVAIVKNSGAASVDPIYFDDAFLWDLGAGPAGRDAGLGYVYANTITAPPSTGTFRLDSTTFSAATKMWLYETDNDGANVGSYIATFDDATGTDRGTIIVQQLQNPAAYLIYKVSGALTDAGNYDEIPITFVASTGTWSNSDRTRIIFIPTGNVGATGAAGADGFDQQLDAISIGAGSSECPGTGGYLIYWGLDDNRDADLDVGERDGVWVNCHGADGANGIDGKNALIKETAEPAGANCADGGSFVEVGLDDDTDGTLDPLEVDDSFYVCHGEEGEPGPIGPAGPAGAGGNNLTVRLVYGPVEEDIPITVYAHVEELGVPVNATGNLTIEVNRVLTETVWADDVDYELMTHTGTTGLYRYEWTPGAQARFNIKVNGTHPNGTFQWHSEVLVTDEGVIETQGDILSMSALTGYTDGETLALLIFAIAALWAGSRRMWIGAATAVLSVIVVAFTPLIPAVAEEWTMPVAILFTFLTIIGNLFFVHAAEAQAAVAADRAKQQG